MCRLPLAGRCAHSTANGTRKCACRDRGRQFDFRIYCRCSLAISILLANSLGRGGRQFALCAAACFVYLLDMIMYGRIVIAC